MKTWSRDFGAIVELVSSVVLVVVTFWYVRLTSRLLQAQIDPAVGWSMEQGNGQPVLKFTNRSNHNIVGLLVFGRDISFYSYKRESQGTSFGNNGLFTWPLVKPNETVSVPLGEFIREAVLLAENRRKLMGTLKSQEMLGLVGTDDIMCGHLLEFRISYERQLDRKTYTINTGPYVPWVQNDIPYVMQYSDLNKIPQPEDYGLSRHFRNNEPHSSPHPKEPKSATSPSSPPA